MRATPLVSVLIPAHNGARWIARCLECLPAAAAGVGFEALVVDNSSSDDTPALAARIPGVRVLRNEANLGFSRAVNLAAASARGRVLTVCNQDLYLKPGSLEAAATLAASREAIVGGRLI